MNVFKKCWARLFQAGMYVGVTIMHFKEPKVVKGENSSKEIYKILQEKGIKDTLVVVDDGLFNVPFTKEIIKALEDHGIKTSVFHDFKANPTIKNVEDGLSIYLNNDCHSIIGLGGGSSMDTAKMIGARVTNPKKTVSDMKGVLKVRHKLPLLIAIPTTAGTGSECTIAAIITDQDTHYKYAIEDPKLTPKIAVLDPKLLENLPPHITSTTGMDALTHAVEAFTNKARTKRTNKFAIEAIKGIYENLYESYKNPHDLERRNNMQVASYKAGVAFTNAYVGYVHAIAHSLGGQYNVPHGLANSLILPIVMKSYGKKIYKRIAKVYDYIEMGDKNISKEAKTKEFIAWMYNMNKAMNITYNFADLIKEEDIPAMVDHAYHEAYPLYPCPKMYDREELTKLYHLVKEENTK